MHRSLDRSIAVLLLTALLTALAPAPATAAPAAAFPGAAVGWPDFAVPSPGLDLPLVPAAAPDPVPEPEPEADLAVRLVAPPGAPAPLAGVEAPAPDYSKTPAMTDAVNPVSGQLSVQAVDLALPAPHLPVAAGRTWTGSAAEGPLGPGWQFTYDQLLRMYVNYDITEWRADGTRFTFRFHEAGPGFVHSSTATR